MRAAELFRIASLGLFLGGATLAGCGSSSSSSDGGSDATVSTGDGSAGDTAVMTSDGGTTSDVSTSGDVAPAGDTGAADVAAAGDVATSGDGSATD
jgi:hypothetical protein